MITSMLMMMAVEVLAGCGSSIDNDDDHNIIRELVVVEVVVGTYGV